MPRVCPASIVILSAKDGKIITSLPLAGGSDGAVFNPSMKEAFSMSQERGPAPGAAVPRAQWRQVRLQS